MAVQRKKTMSAHEAQAKLTKVKFYAKTELQKAVKADNCAAVRKILSNKKVDLNEKNECGQTALHFASHNGQARMAQILMQHGANKNCVDKDKESPLHLAANNGHSEVTYLLIRSGAKLNSREKKYGGTPLYFAVTKGYSEVVRLLVHAGADVHAKLPKGETILQMACGGFDANVLRILLQVVNVNKRLSEGRTPLHWACFYGKLEFVRELANVGADHDTRDNDGCTALFWAVYSGFAAIVRFLVRHGADADVQAADKSTPLHWAATYNRPEIAEMLLQGDCNVDATYNHGITPLHHAAEYGHEEMVHVLLEYGANPNLVCKGKTAMDVANLKNFPAIVAKLRPVTSALGASGMLPTPTAPAEIKSKLHSLPRIQFANMTVLDVCAFLSMKQLRLFVDAFIDHEMSGAKVAALWGSPSGQSKAKAFVKSIRDASWARLKQMCRSGYYTLSDSHRGAMKKKLKELETKLDATLIKGVQWGVVKSAMMSERFCMTMDNAFEARRMFHDADADHSGTLTKEEVVPLFERLGISANVVSLYLEVYDTNHDNEMDIEEFIQFHGEVKHPTRIAKKKIKLLLRSKKGGKHGGPHPPTLKAPGHRPHKHHPPRPVKPEA